MKRKTDNFNKFFNKKRNSAIKEEFRQEKKAAKKERKEAIDRHFEAKRAARQAQYEARGKESGAPPLPLPDQLPLNKYIAHGGVCSRRDAAELIKQGNVTVNGKLVTEPGTKVSPNDNVTFNGKKVTISRNFVYILLNKPKDYITTTDDPQGRKTVLDLIRHATTERVYPVGRLDRNTSGVLLLTNDGDLAQKLAHPRHEIKKIYHATLDKPLTKADFDTIISGGVVLEDGPAIVDVLAYADPKDKTQIGLEIHSGRNRIVRRIFEHLGYDVRGLDRVTYAGLTKKNVQRGKWRLLTEKEIRILKYLNSSFKGSPGKGAKATLREQEIAAAIAGESTPKQAGRSNAATSAAAAPTDDEGWQDPADIDWEAASKTGWEKPAGKKAGKFSPKRQGKQEVDRYTKDQEMKKLPGKKKPPTLTLKAEEQDKDITAEDQAFADRKGYGGKKILPEGRGRKSFSEGRGKKNFSEGRRPEAGRSEAPFKRKAGSTGKTERPYSGRPEGAGKSRRPSTGLQSSGGKGRPSSGRPSSTGRPPSGGAGRPERSGGPGKPARASKGRKNGR